MTRPAASPRPASLAERLGELEKGVTEGPWRAAEHFGPSDPEWWADHGEGVKGVALWMPEGLGWIDEDENGRYLPESDARFIARSRNLWPLLAEAVEAHGRARDEAEALLQLIDDCDFHGDDLVMSNLRAGLLRILADDALGRLAAALDEAALAASPAEEGRDG